MNIVVDLGNTLAKVGIFDHQRLKERHTLEGVDQLRAFLKNFSDANLIISSVGDQAQLVDVMNESRTIIRLSPTTPVPVRIEYATPETLGVDRIAAVCGAQSEFPGENCLVIDAGSCITYELLKGDGTYLGGRIAPGLQMRFKAMHAFTARLPIVAPEGEPLLIGNSTASCMQSGVILGMRDEIDGAICTYSEKFGDLKVILTGGDIGFFENNLKASIFAVPELVLKGLNSILLHNIRD